MKLPSLPTFGADKGSFSFLGPIQHFLFEPIPEPLKSVLTAAPELKSYLAVRGLKSLQDLVTLTNNPITLDIPVKNKDIPAGLLMVNAPLTLIYQKTILAAERIGVATGTPLTLTMYPTTKGPVTLTLNGETYTMKKLGKTSLLTATITAPQTPGRYTISGAPLNLIIDVIAPPKPPTPPKKQGVWGWVTHLFGW